jgi:hypothetical protein
MVSIAADNRDIERSLQKLVMLSKKADAEFSDDLVVKCVDGNLSIEAPPDSVGKVLMRLPWHCLVPLEPFNLSVANDDIVISSHDEGLTRASVALMEAFLELYNLTHKFTMHRRTSPSPSVASPPGLLEYVTRGRGRGLYLRPLPQGQGSLRPGVTTPDAVANRASGEIGLPESKIR